MSNVDGKEGLSKSQREILKKIKESFKYVKNPKVNPQSDLCRDPEFTDYFSNLFSVYHTITEHKFEKKSFEFAFKYGSIAAGHDCQIVKNNSNPGEDVIRNGEGISLKTEGEKSQTTIKISKFSEARFIADYKSEVEERRINGLPSSDSSKSSQLRNLQESREGELREGLAKAFLEAFKHHISRYERIIVLKTNPFEDQSGDVVEYRYRIIEIPKDLLERALNLKADEFTVPDGKGQTKADVWSDQTQKSYTVVLDGSVEKITIRNIKIDECITHAEFNVDVTV